MKKLYLAGITALVLALTANAQNVGIDTNDPKAKLDVVSDNSGILIPRIALTGTNDVATVPDRDVSELVYNTATAGSGSTAVSPGFYYWSGSVWVPLLAGTLMDDDWTRDPVNGDLSPTTLTDKVGIGTDAPEQLLHVKDGEVYIEGTNVPVVQPTLRFNQTGNIISNTGVDVIIDEDDNANNSTFSVKHDGEADIILDVTENGRAAIGKGVTEDNVLLDLNSTTDKGLLIPNLDIGDLGTAAPVASPITDGMLAWNTNTGTGPNLVYWSAADTEWKVVTIADDEDIDWLQLDDTKPTSVGDNIYTEGNVGIGTSAVDADYSLTVQTPGETTDLVKIGGEDHAIHATMNAGSEDVITAEHTSTSSSANFHAVSGELTNKGNTLGMLAYFRNANDKAYGIFSENGDYGGYFEEAVGIGVLDPAQMLHVSGTGRFSTLAAGNGAVVTSNSSGDLGITALTLNANHVLNGLGNFVDASTLTVDHDWYEQSTTTAPDDINDNIFTQGNVGIGGNPAHRLTLVGTGAVFGVDNGSNFQAKNSSGTYENFLWPRWTDDIMYMNFGSGGFNLRNNGSLSALFIDNDRSINIEKGVLFDCDDCGSTSTIDGTSDWGDLVVQGRVLSSSSNLHLSPPSNFGVVINDTYRAAGGSSTGSVFLDVDGYVTVGNPSSPAATPSGTITSFYASGDEGFTGWATESVCGSAAANWGFWYDGDHNANSYALYDNVGSYTRKRAYSPYVWVPTGATNTTFWMHFYCSLEASWDGAIIEYTTNGSSWTKITSFTQGGYNGVADGSNTSCNGTDYQSAWTGGGAGWYLAQATISGVAGNWLRFRVTGFEDGSYADGYMAIYRFLVEGTLPSVGGSFASGNIYAENNVYAGSNVLLGDIAEYFPVSGKSEPGMLISIDRELPDRYAVTSRANDSYILGIHSTNPTITLNDPNSGVPVALRGRVPVKVCGQNGPIRPGDMLTSADLRGHAMKADGPSYIVGRALEYFDGRGEGTILCMIENGWYNPGDARSLASGTFRINRGAENIEVRDPAVGPGSRIFVSLMGDPGARHWIDGKAEGHFTIGLSAPSEREVAFDYFIDGAAPEGPKQVSPENDAVPAANLPAAPGDRVKRDADDLTAMDPPGPEEGRIRIPAAEYRALPPPPVPPHPERRYKWVDGQVIPMEPAGDPPLHKTGKPGAPE